MNADWEKTVLVFMTTALARSFRAKITVEVGFQLNNWEYKLIGLGEPEVISSARYFCPDS